MRRAGNRIRITAQLVDAEEGYQLWSERYDRELADIFAIQDEIAASIVAALRVVLTERERAALPVERTDLRAYEYYLRGRQLAHRVRRESWEGALRMFEQAVAIDPAYAPGLRRDRRLLHLDPHVLPAHRGDDRPGRRGEHAARSSRSGLRRGARVAGVRPLAREALRRGPGRAGAGDRAVAHALRGALPVRAGVLGRGEAGRAERHFQEAAAVRPDDYQAVGLLASVYDRQSQPERRKAYRQTAERARRHWSCTPTMPGPSTAGRSRSGGWARTARHGCGPPGRWRRPGTTRRPAIGVLLRPRRAATTEPSSAWSVRSPAAFPSGMGGA